MIVWQLLLLLGLGVMAAVAGGAYLGARRAIALPLLALMDTNTSTQTKLEQLSGHVALLGTAIETMQTAVNTEVQQLAGQNADLTRQLGDARAAAAANNSTALDQALDGIDITISGYITSVAALQAAVLPGTPVAPAAASSTTDPLATTGDATLPASA